MKLDDRIADQPVWQSCCVTPWKPRSALRLGWRLCALSIVHISICISKLLVIVMESFLLLMHQFIGMPNLCMHCFTLKREEFIVVERL